MPEFYDPYNHAVPKIPEHLLGQRRVQQKLSEEYGEPVISIGNKYESLMHNHKQIIKTLGQLAIPSYGYVVIGGASLVLRNIKETTEDIDMLVSESSFDRLGYRADSLIDTPPRHAIENGATNETIHVYPRSLMPVSAFTYLNGNGYHPMTFRSVESTSELIDGIPVSSIEEVVASKQALGRYKDISDLELIAEKYGLPLHIPNLKML
jgi:hypothetical protein